MKSLILKLLPIIFIIIAVALYGNTYNIKYNDLSNNIDLKNDINMLEKNQSPCQYTVYSYADFKNYRYVLLVINNKDLGIVQLKKGINKRYTIEEVVINQYPARTEVQPILSNPGTFLIYGSNIKGLISSFSFNINNQITIEDKIPVGDYFINLVNVYNSNINLYNITNFTLLDKDHREVNNNYYLGSPTVVMSEDMNPTYYLIIISIIIAISFIFINIFKKLKQIKRCV